MLWAKNKNVKVLGYPKSSLTQELFWMVREDCTGSADIMLPEEFLEHGSKDYSYLVAFSLDKKMRKQVIDKLSNGFDSLTFIHNTCVCNFDKHNIESVIGKGTFIAPMAMILVDAKVGEHCIIETSCLVAHYTTLGDNVHLHAGTMLAGKINVGSDCEFNFKSSVLPAVNVCSNVLLGATSTITKDITKPGKYVGTPARYVGEWLV